VVDVSLTASLLEESSEVWTDSYNSVKGQKRKSFNIDKEGMKKVIRKMKKAEGEFKGEAEEFKCTVWNPVAHIATIHREVAREDLNKDQASFSIKEIMVAGILLVVAASYFIEVTSSMTLLTKMPSFSEFIQFFILIVLIQIHKMVKIYLQQITEDSAEMLFMCNSTGGTFLEIHEKLGYLELRI